jgi:ArsR family transcriptional regulator
VKEIDVFKLLDLLGNKTRRNIIGLLSNKPCYVTELSGRLNIAPKAIIRHLSQLDEAGLIESYLAEQNRKYFRIVNNFYISMIISSHRVGIEATPIDREVEDRTRDISFLPKFDELFDELNDLKREADAIEKLGGYIGLKYMSRELIKLSEMENRMNAAIRSVESLLVRIAGEMFERIDDLEVGSTERKILRLIVNKELTTEEIEYMLDLSSHTVDESLKNLWEAGVIIKKIVGNEEVWSII